MRTQVRQASVCSILVFLSPHLSTALYNKAYQIFLYLTSDDHALDNVAPRAFYHIFDGENMAKCPGMRLWAGYKGFISVVVMLYLSVFDSLQGKFCWTAYSICYVYKP